MFFANADFVRTRIRTIAEDVPDLLRVVVDGRSIPSIDVTAAGMLMLLKADLDRVGADLVLADNVGQVRDVLSEAEPDVEPVLHRDLEEAVASATRLARPPAAEPDRPFTVSG